MAVIINEFEIIPERPAVQQEQSAAQPPVQASAPPLRPEEIVRIQRVDRERRRRVRAS